MKGFSRQKNNTFGQSLVLTYSSLLYNYHLGLGCHSTYSVPRLAQKRQYPFAFRHHARVKMDPVVSATIQAAVLSAISNILAQLISCHREGVRLEPITLVIDANIDLQHGYTIDTTPLVISVVYALLSCPPNYLWQSWMESKFPGYTSPDDAGTVASITQQPQVKAALDAAGPTLQRIEETTTPALQKASAATTALADNDTVKSARRRASEGVDTVRAKTQELEARAGINHSPMAKSPARSQTFSTSDGQTIEKKVDGAFAQPPPASAPKVLSVKNTAIKFALDQTFGAAINNALYILGIAFLQGQSADAAFSALRTVRILFHLRFAELY